MRLSPNLPLGGQCEAMPIQHVDSALRLTSSPGRISGGEQWRYGWRKAAVLGR